MSLVRDVSDIYRVGVEAHPHRRGWVPWFRVTFGRRAEPGRRVVPYIFYIEIGRLTFSLRRKKDDHGT